MRIYWSLPPLPELAAFSGSERKRILQSCSREGLLKGKSLIGLAICGICAALGSLAGDSLGIGIWGAAAGGGIGGFIASQFMIRSTLEVLKKRYPSTEGPLASNH